MSTNQTQRALRMLKLTAGGALVALAVSACQVGTTESTEPDSAVEEQAPVTQEPVDDEPTDDEPIDDEPTDDEPVGDEPTDDEPTDDEPTDDEPTDNEPTSAGDSGDVAAPGTEVAVGESAVIHVQALQPGDEFYGHATMNATVTSVEEGDKALFEEAENAADFAGLTPWFIQVEYEWLTYEGQPNSNMVPALVGFNNEGGEVGTVRNSTWSAGIPGCESDIPHRDDRAPGVVATTCHVYAVPDTLTLGAVGWTGDDTIDGSGRDNPYNADPVRWVVTD